MGVWGASVAGTGVSQKQRTQAGGALYHLQNASSVKLSILSYAGVMVSQHPKGGFALGQWDFSSPYSPTFGQARFSPSRGQVYTVQNGEVLQAVYDSEQFYFAFVKSGADLPSDLVPMGAHVSASSDGANFNTLSLRLLGGEARQGNSMVLETFAASLPPNTTHLRVEINSRVSTLTINGDAQNIVMGLDTLLTSVEIQGEDLKFGASVSSQTESEITTPPPSSSSMASSSGSARKKTSSEKQSSPVSDFLGEARKDEASSKAASKFEGEATVESSRKSSSRSSASQENERSSSASASSVQYSSTEEAAQELRARGSHCIFHKEEKADSFQTGIVVYLVALCAVILFLILRPRQNTAILAEEEDDTEL